MGQATFLGLRTFKWGILWSDPLRTPWLKRQSRRSPPLETGAGSGAESPHEEPSLPPCPVLAAGLRGGLSAHRSLR